MRGPFTRLLEGVDGQGCAAMVSVVDVSGSAPREAGARMVVLPDNSFTGTIGGGALEWQAIAIAQAALARMKLPFEMRSIPLGPDLGQCCGGRVELAIELFAAKDRRELATLAGLETQHDEFCTTGVVGADGRLHRTLAPSSVTRATNPPGWRNGVLSEHFGETWRELVLFGAGHVGRALALALAPLPFLVSWIDSRPGAFPAASPSNVRPMALDDPTDAIEGAEPGAFILVMTHSHALDLAIVAAALGAGHFPYVGLIGSATKRARFERQLAAAGIHRLAIGNLVCPIGVAGIDGKGPALIAAATVAELLVRDQEVRQGRRGSGLAGLPAEAVNGGI